VVDIATGATTTIKVIRTQAENSNAAADPSADFGTTHSYTVYGSGGSVVATGTAINTITPPEVEPNSGSIAYYENRKPITRADNQIEDVKVAFQF
jgi:hypothetical protein